MVPEGDISKVGFVEVTVTVPAASALAVKVYTATEEGEPTKTEPKFVPVDGATNKLPLAVPVTVTDGEWLTVPPEKVILPE